jgi:5-methylcytosine-specific restriction endonuclease McrA
MRTLTPPPVDAADAYERISDRRGPPARRLRLLQAKPRVLGSYVVYTGNPDEIVELTPANTSPATADDLRGNYDSKNRAKRAMRGTILGHNARGRCGLCACRAASTLDHYLPRTTYPEFSVLPLNLVPACWDCNHTKATKHVRGEAAGAAFIHAYLDAGLNDVRFLYTELAVSAGEPMVSYYVDPPGDLPDGLSERIRSHFAELRLATLYLYEAVNELSERRGAIEALWDSGATTATVAQYFRREADSVGSSAGLNHWRYVLLDALAAQPRVFVTP